MIAAPSDTGRRLGWRAVSTAEQDRADFVEFVHARQHAMLRFAYLLTSDHHTAEDLVQTTFVALYRAWPRLSSWDHPRAYARRALTNTYLSARRRRSAQEQLFALPPDSRRNGSAGPDASAAVVERERQRELLRRLPPRQRAVLVLRFWEDCSVADTARLLGVTPGTVKSQTADALAALRRSMAAGAAEGAGS
jgi:RNA polymerase sigma-70 factor (sigma-E family)